MQKIIMILLFAFSLSTYAFCDASLLEYIRHDQIDEIKAYLADNNVDLNAVDEDGNCPIVFAISERKPEIVTMLLDLGTNPNLRNTWDIPLICFAVNAGDLEIIKILVDHGAEMDFCSSVDGGVIHAAISTNDPDVIRYAVSAGADIECTTEWDTPLIYAIGESSAEVVKTLVELGADVNKAHKFGPYAYGSPLMYLVLRSDYELFEYFLQHGLKLEPLESGWTALMSAASINDVRIGKRLVELGVDPNALTETGDTALSVAEKRGYHEFMDFITTVARDR